MSSQRRQMVVRDLVEEGKKRIVFLAICVVGLSYLMSLTSSSVWINLPAAASFIIVIRYLSLDFEMRKKAAIYNNNKPSSANTLSHDKPLEYTKAIERSNWRRKVNSPLVEDAIDHFTKHLVSEWVTNLWYGRLTPDKEGPEELVRIINGVLGEISGRMRNINLIDLLTRDLIHLICTHLELFRASQAKTEIQDPGSLTIEYRDMELRRILVAENKLHPALFSAEAEHKVLQHLMDGLISFTFKPEDLQCSFFRFAVRELLACAVMRPVLNLASPRFINERIEALIISRSKSGKVSTAAEDVSLSKPSGSSRISSDHFLDPEGNGVELMQLKADQSKTATNKLVSDNVNEPRISKDPLLSVDARSSRSFGSFPINPRIIDGKGVIRHISGGEWGDTLDQISIRKTQVLAPENFESMWAKGKNYKKKEDKIIEQVPQNSSIGKTALSGQINSTFKPNERDSLKNLSKNTAARSGWTDQSAIQTSLTLNDKQVSNSSSVASYSEDDEHNLTDFEEASTSSGTSEDEENDNVTGLGSPGTKVWDGKSNRTQAVVHIHHPLEKFEGRNGKKTGRRHVNHRSATGIQSGKKYKSELPIWQEIERTSFLSGDGLDVLNSPAGHANAEECSDDSETENYGRVHSGATASSSAASSSIPGTRHLNDNSVQSSLLVDSYYKLKCEVLGANIVKSDSRTFAVYSISVTDVNNNSWSIKRRFRHFEELHRRLKEYLEYNLHLPPKHFLSTSLDVPIIRERCKLLDKYLKKLLQLPTISGSIEVWDFLCVDSQTYLFSNSFSILQTLSVDQDEKPSEAYRVTKNAGSVVNPLSPRKEYLGAENKGSALPMKHNVGAGGLRLDGKGISHLSVNKPSNDNAKSENPIHDPEARVHNDVSSIRHRERTIKQEHSALPETYELLPDATVDQNLPTEWVPPNLTIPILDLVDVVFQLHDGGWIRRNAFWVAKQILHLGMGDAVDDWVIEKIQLLRKGSVVASAIQRIEQILWPDGIFITKHPKRQRPPPSPSSSSPSNHQPEMASPRAVDEQQKLEADRRAKFVYELMIENAPAGIAGLVGRKEYEQCAKDLYFFIQSSVCVKQLVFDLLELLLVSAFPEMDYVFKQLHEEKHRFGEFKSSPIS